MFRRRMIQREIFRVLDPSPLWRKERCYGSAQDNFAPVIEPSLLSRGARLS